MTKRPEPNPDRVKWENDQKQKKLTKRHFKQKLDWQRKCLKQQEEWFKRDQERLDEARLKLLQMELEYERMV